MLPQEVDRQKLPPGRHGIPAEVVERSQRERLVAGMAEACAESGYLATSVSDISRRAGVSTQTFYRLFSNRLDCMLASHEILLGRLLGEIDVACALGSGTGEGLRAGVRGALMALSADPAAAQLLTLEIMAAGPEGVRRHYGACERVAARLREHSPSRLPRSAPVSWALVATMGMRVGKQVMDGEAETLAELEDEFLLLMASPI
jgi:AcrR family transcriptional regulator